MPPAIAPVLLCFSGGSLTIAGDVDSEPCVVIVEVEVLVALDVEEDVGPMPLKPMCEYTFTCQYNRRQTIFSLSSARVGSKLLSD